ncbi:restriction endonuclease subunit S [Staphylococcus aureus]|uniref:restriction endonuclease subunit S n=1 Tax=Staphylococcus aureus TaxID=1280 RepID=UPI000D5955FC|nr:restriction endonuclease subunit S [Staphylococcus aureus]AWI95128.1 restriction endonuclease subunit S [Staphylococcus aureus]
MEYRKLGDYCEVKGGKRLPKGEQLVEYETNHPYLRISDYSNGSVNLNNLKYVTEETFQKISRYIINEGDIFLSIVGTIGIVDFIDYKLDSASLTENAVRIRSFNESVLSTKFLSYFLKSDQGQNEMFIRTVGSTQPKLAITRIKDINIPIIDIKSQQKISNILSTIDEKITLNKNLIANLEELSKTLFKRWFVDFEFPDENGNPYKSSGGEMVDSELGKIPKGWECVYLKDIVHHKKDTFNPKKSNESEVKHFSLPAFDSGQYPTIDNVTDIKSNKWIIDENCILFSKMNPTTRRIWVTSYNENFLNVASSEFVVLKSDNSYRNAFIYNICISDKFNEYLVSNTTGSTNSRQRVKPDIAVQYRFAYNEEVSYLLSEKIEPYIEKIKIIREQNQNLTQIRDTLLPKLMSGEIEIPDDIEVNEDELSI